jgi:hypothetical protein
MLKLKTPNILMLLLNIIDITILTLTRIKDLTQISWLLKIAPCTQIIGHTLYTYSEPYKWVVDMFLLMWHGINKL